MKIIMATHSSQLVDMAVHSAHAVGALSVRGIEDAVVPSAATAPAFFLMGMPAGFPAGLFRQYSDDVHVLLMVRPPYANGAHGGIGQSFLM